MPPSRIELLRTFIVQRPEDPFPRYALAIEHKNAGRIEEAWNEFEVLLKAHPNYIPTYLHAGGTLVGLGRAAEAADVYRRGIDASTRMGDGHARGELEGALSLL